jgi:hypothetical protein
MTDTRPTRSARLRAAGHQYCTPATSSPHSKHSAVGLGVSGNRRPMSLRTKIR